MPTTVVCVQAVSSRGSSQTFGTCRNFSPFSFLRRQNPMLPPFSSISHSSLSLSFRGVVVSHFSLFLTPPQPQSHLRI